MERINRCQLSPPLPTPRRKLNGKKFVEKNDREEKLEEIIVYLVSTVFRYFSYLNFGDQYRSPFVPKDRGGKFLNWACNQQEDIDIKLEKFMKMYLDSVNKCKELQSANEEDKVKIVRLTDQTQKLQKIQTENEQVIESLERECDGLIGDIEDLEDFFNKNSDQQKQQMLQGIKGLEKKIACCEEEITELKAQLNQACKRLRQSEQEKAYFKRALSEFKLKPKPRPIEDECMLFVGVDLSEYNDVFEEEDSLAQSHDGEESSFVAKSSDKSVPAPRFSKQSFVKSLSFSPEEMDFVLTLERRTVSSPTLSSLKIIRTKSGTEIYDL